LLFDRNGLAGLAFYWSLIGLAASAFVDDMPINPALFAALAAVSALAVAFAELLAHLVEGHRPLVEGSFGTYLMQAFFELFEAVIGLLSNTLSYVRMGAFAVAHGALSLVVFIMAEIVSPSRGVGYWIVVALGNLFVIGFEGMIVGIQTLRLEYYEFFSKFFSGSGVSFHPLTLISKGE
jgi:V/A-type H+-transporting ATPase subunit I